MQRLGLWWQDLHRKSSISPIPIQSYYYKHTYTPYHLNSKLQILFIDLFKAGVLILTHGGFEIVQVQVLKNKKGQLDSTRLIIHVKGRTYQKFFQITSWLLKVTILFSTEASQTIPQWSCSGQSSFSRPSGKYSQVRSHSSGDSRGNCLRQICNTRPSFLHTITRVQADLARFLQNAQDCVPEANPHGTCW